MYSILEGYFGTLAQPNVGGGGVWGQVPPCFSGGTLLVLQLSHLESGDDSLSAKVYFWGGVERKVQCHSDGD